MQKTIRYLAIDDNIIDLLLLKEYAADFPLLHLSDTCSQPNEAIDTIDQLKPDLLFIDIEMPGISGLEVLKKIKQKVPITIFVTSHPEFALDGFELAAFDYIIKPLTKERFATTIKRVQEYWEMKQKATAYEILFENDFLIIKEGYSHVKLPVHEIIYLEAMHDYTKVVTEKKYYLTLTTLTGFLEKLSSEKFKRIHRSYAVALTKISAITSNSLICGPFTIPVGKTYRNEINQLKLL